jgi:hypothetical protein
MASSDNTSEQYAKDLLFTDGLPIIEEEQGYRGQMLRAQQELPIASLITGLAPA